MRLLLARALNRNQILILKELGVYEATITSLVKFLSVKYMISESTLKSNTRVLRALNLIKFGGGSEAKLTEFGSLVLSILNSAEECL